ncbi:MAG: saccharopine dehydrogenase family protein [Gammaproteobacteria bacterium]
MTIRVLIIGGYGNFGTFISRALAKEPNIQLIIAGRNLHKAQQLTASMDAELTPEAVAIDIHQPLDSILQVVQPNIVIHTSGPFQNQNYQVAEACLAIGAHYIDLADGRDFVSHINQLDRQAKARNLLLISGASSVPCLTSAVIDHYLGQFSPLESVDYGITTAQKTARGQATTAAILGYTGKAFPALDSGKVAQRYGWQGLRLRYFPQIGRRLLSYCDIPDLALFPQRYPELKTIRFYAGLEIPFIHLGLWVLSWGVRCGLIKNLPRVAPLLLRLASWCDFLGTSDSGFFMTLSGTGPHNEAKSLTFELTAKSGDGPYIPCIPAILLAKKIADGRLQETGAKPCIGLISLEEYLQALQPMDISWTDDAGTQAADT